MSSGTGGTSGDARPSPPRLDKVWWENILNDEVIAGDWKGIDWDAWKKIDTEKRKDKKKEDIYDENKLKNENLKESDYGKSVKIIVKTIGIPDGADVEVKIYKKSFFPWEDDEELFIDKKDKNKKLTGKIKNNHAIIPVFLIYLNKDGDWCGKDKKWYEIHKGWYKNYTKFFFISQTIKPLIKTLKDRFDLKVKVTWKENTVIDGGKKNEIEKSIEGRLASEDYLTVWPPPALIMHAEAEVEKFIDGGDIRPIPQKNGWQEEDKRGYWYRLGRAYKGSGVMGKQIIKYIYTKRDKLEYDTIEVTNVRWRGSQGEFEHPTPNIKEASDVGYESGSKTHFFFLVIDAHEKSVFIHGGKGSEGCFLIGGDEPNPRYNESKDKEPKDPEDMKDPKNKQAALIWDIMDQLLNKNYKDYRKDKNGKVKEFENGAVKITSDVTKDKVTKLDYDYDRIHETGLDNKNYRDGKQDAGLSAQSGPDRINEKEGIDKNAKALTDTQLLDFLIKVHHKTSRESKHSDYFKWWDRQ